MNNSKTKTCQNCKSKFRIEPEDFEFYKKIDVPEPTFCPHCRAQRRFSFWNTAELYKGKCAFSGEDIVTVYKPETQYKIFHSKYWWGDKWDPMEYGQDLDFSRPFLEQFRKLMLDVPRAHNFNVGSVNCDYCAGTYNSKNCYMSNCNRSEDCFYSIAMKSRDCFECFLVTNCENCTNAMLCDNCFDVHFAEYCRDCMDSAFLYDCRNCQNCFGCVNLRNKQYHIFNKKYSKAEYERELKKYDLSDHEKLEKVKEKFEKFKILHPKRFARINNSQNVTGDNISNSKNCKHSFFILDGAENGKYIYSCSNMNDCMDCFDVGTKAELCYETTTAGADSSKILFSVNVGKKAYYIEYSNECYSSSNLFGCAGLRHKKYCILNKQYTKQEYEKLVPKIKQHMNDVPFVDKKGRVYKYGELFPLEFSPHDYNKSIAQENVFLSKEEILRQGYNWYDAPPPEKKPTMKASDLPQKTSDVTDGILKEVIECGNLECEGRKIFQIVPKELDYYRRHRLALPRTCFHCRYWERMRKKSPIKLWKRRCMCDHKTYKNGQEHKHGDKSCENTFETTYAPDRPEIVYCKDCYQREAE